MSSVRAIEETLLEPARTYIAGATSHLPLTLQYEARFQILETVAAELGGFDLDWYRSIVGIQAPRIRVNPSALAANLLAILGSVRIHPALALASLSRPVLSATERRNRGAYYTDFRLAKYLARSISGKKRFRGYVLDPASGTGVLLAASAIEIGTSAKDISRFIGDHVCAADLSPDALRGVLLALSSLARSKGAIASLACRVRQVDSLVAGADAWADLKSDGIRLIVTNPPWEKLKLSLHEHLLRNGHNRHYGARKIEKYDESGLIRERHAITRYIADLEARYDCYEGGDKDLYVYFIELCLKLLRADGQLLSIVPAGLIRSKGTETLRKRIVEKASRLSISVFENRARFFAIDTRFKFLVLNAQIRDSGQRGPLALSFPKCAQNEVKATRAIRISRQELIELRPDLTIPEVRTLEDWRLFRRVSWNHPPFADKGGNWKPVFLREVDMTFDSKQFSRTRMSGYVPLIEGRMVHQFNSAAKDYHCGTGRAAIWEWNERNPSKVSPQYWYPIRKLSRQALERLSISRVGYCDVTGQTNERTMLAAEIPAGAACGNKVPTIIFLEDENQTKKWCWLALANSLIFDWLLRRLVTTTVNFFILRSVPIPEINPESLPWRFLSKRVRFYMKEIQHGADKWGLSELRAEFEWRCARAYRCTFRDLEIVLADFPLLDRSQPPIFGEDRSTITRDLVLFRAAENLGGCNQAQLVRLQNRVMTARCIGAVPFHPTDHAVDSEEVITRSEGLRKAVRSSEIRTA